MTNEELIAVFAIAMAAICIVAIGIDWLGKPIKRRFIPKIYRYPDELAPAPDPTRTQWSDETFRVPENPPDGAPIGYLDGSTEWSQAELIVPELAGPPTAENPAVFAEIPDDLLADDPEPEPKPEPEATAEQEPEPEPEPEPEAEPEPEPEAEPELEDQDPPDLPKRTRGWTPGEYVFNRTRQGGEPSQKVITRRFWRNVAATDFVTTFGTANTERVKAGKAPARRNPRTGKNEFMELPEIGYLEAKGKPPIPTWGDDAVDPYAHS